MLSGEQIKDYEQVSSWIQAARPEDFGTRHPTATSPSMLTQIISKWASSSNQGIMTELHQKQIPFPIWKEALQDFQKTNIQGISPLLAGIFPDPDLLSLRKGSKLVPELAQLCTKEQELEMLISKLRASLSDDPTFLLAIFKQAFDQNWNGALAEIVDKTGRTQMLRALSASFTNNGPTLLSEICSKAGANAIQRLVKSYAKTLDTVDPAVGKTARELLKARSDLIVDEETREVINSK